MHNPSTKHWQAMTHILCYLAGTFDYAFFFPRGEDSQKHVMQLLGYSHSIRLVILILITLPMEIDSSWEMLVFHG